MERVRVDRSEFDSIIEFAQTNPSKPQHPPSLIRRFLNDFISSNDLIFDFHDSEGRVAVAVLLDRIQNTTNDACLEIIGVRANTEFGVILSTMIPIVEKTIPSDRAGFQLVLADDIKITERLLPKLGLREYYDAYKMSASSRDDAESPSALQEAEKADGDELYDLFCRSFAESLDTSISEAQSWKTNFLVDPRSHYYVWRSERGLLGFANLFVDETTSAEIRTIGVSPEARGSGIGNKLLRHCMMQAKRMGKSECHLTVAVQNKRALGLYIRAGFKPTELYKCYRKPRV